MPKLTKYDGATDGDPVAWLDNYCTTHGWDVWIREKGGGGSFTVGMSLGVVERASDSKDTLKLALEDVTNTIVDSVLDLLE